MKKALSLMVCALALFAFTVSSAKAAGPFNFYIRGGIMTSSDFSFSSVLGLAGANIDFNFGALSLSPECDLLIYQFTFNPAFITPGVILNMNLAALYVGAGVVKPVMITGSGYTLGDFLFKLNAGLKIGNLKLQAFVITAFDHFFSSGDTWVGATLGTGF
jgi:hypothetical protein